MTTNNGSSSTPSSNRDQGNNSALSDESDVIELVDVVRKNPPPNNPDSGPSEKDDTAHIEKHTEIDLDELTREMDILSENMSDPDKEEDSLSSSDFDFETHEESAPEDSTDFPDEELEEIMSKLEQEGRNSRQLNPVPVEISPGMSEEKMEALIRDVVEKAVRESMARVAETVIKEAIDSLKESLKT